MTPAEDGLQVRFEQLSQQLNQKEEAVQRRGEKIESLSPALRKQNISHFKVRAEEYVAKMETEMNKGRLDLARIHQDLARSYLDMVEKV